MYQTPFVEMDDEYPVADLVINFFNPAKGVIAKRELHIYEKTTSTKQQKGLEFKPSATR